MPCPISFGEVQGQDLHCCARRVCWWEREKAAGQEKLVQRISSHREGMAMDRLSVVTVGTLSFFKPERL